ncbi:MAG: hypothetical protein V1922_04825 [bacterium]
MEQFNKALSFILGLVVVAVFIIVASGKINLKGISLPTAKTAIKITPTVTPILTPKPTSKPFFSFFSKPAATPTPKPTAKSTGAPKTTVKSTSSVQQQTNQDPNYHPYSSSSVAQTPSSIPNTGVPVVLFPLLGTSLITGLFMKKTGKKD